MQLPSHLLTLSFASCVFVWIYNCVEFAQLILEDALDDEGLTAHQLDEEAVGKFAATAAPEVDTTNAEVSFCC